MNFLQKKKKNHINNNKSLYFSLCLEYIIHKNMVFKFYLKLLNSCKMKIDSKIIFIRWFVTRVLFLTFFYGVRSVRYFE